jgi:hypothetical protein
MKFFEQIPAFAIENPVRDTALTQDILYLRKKVTDLAQGGKAAIFGHTDGDGVGSIAAFKKMFRGINEGVPRDRRITPHFGNIDYDHLREVDGYVSSHPKKDLLGTTLFLLDFGPHLTELSRWSKHFNEIIILDHHPNRPDLDELSTTYSNFSYLNPIQSSSRSEVSISYISALLADTFGVNAYVPSRMACEIYGFRKDISLLRNMFAPGGRGVTSKSLEHCVDLSRMLFSLGRQSCGPLSTEISKSGSFTQLELRLEDKVDHTSRYLTKAHRTVSLTELADLAIKEAITNAEDHFGIPVYEIHHFELPDYLRKHIMQQEKPKTGIFVKVKGPEVKVSIRSNRRLLPKLARAAREIGTENFGGHERAAGIVLPRKKWRKNLDILCQNLN